MVNQAHTGTTPNGLTPTSSTRTRVEWDQDRNEPYVAIPGFPSVRLTPLKKSDANRIAEMANDPRIGKWSFRRPYPFYPEDAMWFFDNFGPDCQATADSLKDLLAEGKAPPPVAFPMQAIRYVPPTTPTPTPFTSTIDPAESRSEASSHTTPGQTNGAIPVAIIDPLADLGLEPGQFLGNVHSYPTNPEETPKMGMDMARAGGSTHDISYDLSPAIWGKGLGWRCVKAMFESWHEWAGVDSAIANIEVVNTASQACVRKCGFVQQKTFVEDWPIEKGGGQRELVRMEWTNPRHSNGS